jgi:hypothetical protein
VFRTRHLGDEALPGRVVEGRAESEGEGDQVDVPGDGHAGDGQHAEDGGAEREPGLGDLEDEALVEAVGDQPAVRGQQQHGQELQPGGDAHGQT